MDNFNLIKSIIVLTALISIFGAAATMYLQSFPSNVCDCVSHDLRYYFRNMFSSDMVQDEKSSRPDYSRSCIFNYIYRSGNYSECAELGPRCADFLESKGISCTEEICGTQTSAQEIDEIRKNSAFISDPNWVQNTDEGKRLLEAYKSKIAQGDSVAAAEIWQELSAFMNSTIDNRTLKVKTTKELFDAIENSDPRNYLSSMGCFI